MILYLRENHIKVCIQIFLFFNRCCSTCGMDSRFGVDVEKYMQVGRN